MITGQPFGLAFLVWAVMMIAIVTAIAIVVLALHRWSYAAEMQADALDRLATAIERGALPSGARQADAAPASPARIDSP